LKAEILFDATKDDPNHEQDGGTLPGAFKIGRQAQQPAVSTPTEDNGALTASWGNALCNGVFDVEVLGQVDTSAITEIQVEKMVNFVHEAGTLPATITAIAGLPGGVAVTGTRGEVIPGGSQTQFSMNSIESCPRVGWWATTSVWRGRGNIGLNESPLFVSQVHFLEEVPHSTGIFAPLCVSRIFGLKKIKKRADEWEAPAQVNKIPAGIPGVNWG
jgi:hypothetical protein